MKVRKRGPILDAEQWWPEDRTSCAGCPVIRGAEGRGEAGQRISRCVQYPAPDYPACLLRYCTTLEPGHWLIYDPDGLQVVGPDVLDLIYGRVDDEGSPPLGVVVATRAVGEERHVLLAVPVTGRWLLPVGTEAWYRLRPGLPARVADVITAADVAELVEVV